MARRATTVCPEWSSVRSTSARSRELHVRIVGGDLLKATLQNDGSAFVYEEGTPVTLHLPPDALRVLRPSSAASTAEADDVAASVPAGA